MTAAPTHETFVDRINKLMHDLVDDGCYDRANQLLDLLEEYDLVKEDDFDQYEEEDADSEDVRD